eukprot:COSAG02_NODE_5434_length_4333_cov_4.508266_4_plen_354_part_01
MVALEGLRMSELMDRARALGAPQDFLDELMDTDQPRQALLDMLRARMAEKEEGELGNLVATLREDAKALSTAARVPKKNDQRHVRPLETLSTMIELAATRADVALELASMQVPESVAVMMQDAFEADDPRAVNGAVLPPATLLLATLSAHQECHAWFVGSGAVAILVGILNLPDTTDQATAELVRLAAAALANLASPPEHGPEASTAVAKEIFAAGGLVPLIELVEGTRTVGRGPSPEHARTQHWAAAALTNFSHHGQRARDVLIKRGAVEAIAVALRRLTADATSTAELKPDASDDTAELTEDGATVMPSPGSIIEMLLGCLANIAPHKPEELLDAGAVEAALQVLEEAPLYT